MRSLLIRIVGGFYNLVSFVSSDYAADRAIHLFSSPRRKKYNDSQKDFLGTAYKEEIEYDGLGIMTYRWLGDKDGVLLLHGWESNSYRWRKIIERLKSNGHCVIAVDAPAHGASKGKIFNAVLYAEIINLVFKKFNPKIMIGHSVGGMAAAVAVEKYRFESLKKLILLGAPSDFIDVLERYTKMMGYNQKIVKKTKELLKSRFGKEPSEFSTSKYLTAHKSKGLIIHDENDQIIPYNDAIKINQSFKDSLLITTKGFGHSLAHESVTDHIFDFIQEKPQRLMYQ